MPSTTIKKFKKDKPLTARQFLHQNLNKFKTQKEIVAACIAETKGGEKRIIELYNQEVRAAENNGDPSVPKVKPVGRTLDSFTKQFDWRGKIRDAIKSELEKPSAKVYTDIEFRLLCDVHRHLWRGASNTTEFDHYKITIRGVLYWTSKTNVDRIRALDV